MLMLQAHHPHSFDSPPNLDNFLLPVHHARRPIFTRSYSSGLNMFSSPSYSARSSPMESDEIISVPEILLKPTLATGVFLAAWKQSAVLAVLVSFLHSHYELLSFCHVSKEMRALVGSAFDAHENVRHALLCRFVPGYSSSQKPQVNKSIQIDLTDLELLLESEHVSLVNYPMHALSIIASNGNQLTPEQIETTRRFQTLSLTHSRFIAYLRPRTGSPLLSEDEDDAIHLPVDVDPKEVIFPPPLCYFSQIQEPIIPIADPSVYPALMTKPASEPPSPKSMKKRRLSTRLSLRPRSSSKSSTRSTPPPLPVTPLTASPRPPSSYPASLRGSPQIASPLPVPTSPFTVDHRRSRSYTTMASSPTVSPMGTINGTGSLNHRRMRSGHSELPPTPNFPGSLRMRKSSRPISSRSMPFLVTPPGSAGGEDAMSTFPRQPSPQQPAPSSIHSLAQVFRLTRAPVLRVFVPCSILSSTVLVQCMKQLHQASLQDHIRAGDLVCNLGYVPEEGEEAAGWMVFDGHELAPLLSLPTLGRDGRPIGGGVVPVRNASFVLTSPHYYSHVIPGGQNPKFLLSIPLTADYLRTKSPEFTLTRTSLLLPPKGGSTLKRRLNRFAWVARVESARWGTEWILEAEGTKEGREYIERALMESRRGGEQEWEMVRENTGRGRVYIRRV